MIRSSCIMGHEFIGEVVALGASFHPSSSSRPNLYSTLRVGDKVVSPFTVSCGECQCVVSFIHPPNQYSHMLHAVFAELDSRAVASSPVCLVLPSRQGDKPNMSGFAGLEVPCTVCRIFLTDLCSLILLCCCCVTFFPPEYSPHSRHSVTQRLYQLQPGNLTHLAPVFRKWEISHFYPSWKKTNH